MLHTALSRQASGYTTWLVYRRNVVLYRLQPAWTRFLYRQRPLSTSTRRHKAITEAASDSTWRTSPVPVPFRKQLKDERRASRNGDTKPKQKSSPSLDGWELTVGIEIHAQLNTERKLFSAARATGSDETNSQVELFDLSLPGSQPQFQKATLLPAIRAALALNCTVQKVSRFDRKHYFYQDQPAGYQITQYYQPFAKDGHVVLDKHDGIAAADGQRVEIGIKQIQMEQDTAKTVQQPPDNVLLDFNRVGQPLIEIITLPQIHQPETAAACVRKIQDVLQAVNAVTTGMELGGLRADINVSVRRRHEKPGPNSYHGVTGLGQRTEIKNLSSFKAVEEAIKAERDRQIAVLTAGGTIVGETRGWTIGSTETRKLREKEGEVDYRYMPDPDLPPIVIGNELVRHLASTLPALPDAQTATLVEQYGLTMKDAKTLVGLDDGRRLDYFYDVLEHLTASSVDTKRTGTVTANWVLHELGGLLSASDTRFQDIDLSSKSMAEIIDALHKGTVTGRSAKHLLALSFSGDGRSIQAIIEEEGLALERLSDSVYESMARKLIEENSDVAAKVRAGQRGKIQWLVGQMMRQGQGQVEAERARQVVMKLLDTEER